MSRMPPGILRFPSVKARTTVPRSTAYLWMSQGNFPKPIKLGGRAVGWLEEDIEQWLNQRIEQSRGGAKK